MEETRVSLTDKIETLENTLKDTVQQTLHTATDTVENVTGDVQETVENVKDAVAGSVEAVKETVQETVESVKETVHSTVESVKEAFNLRRHVERHPWAMLGGALALGFLGGRLLSGAQRRRQSRRSHRDEHAFSGSDTAANVFAPTQAPERRQEAEQQPEEQKPSWLGQIGENFGEELSKLKGLALGATFGVLRDMLATSIPEQMKPQLTDVINNVTTKLGGRVFQGPVFETNEDESNQGDGHDGHHSREEAGRTMDAARWSG